MTDHDPELTALVQEIVCLIDRGERCFVAGSIAVYAEKRVQEACAELSAIDAKDAHARVEEAVQEEREREGRRLEQLRKALRIINAHLDDLVAYRIRARSDKSEAAADCQICEGTGWLQCLHGEGGDG